MLREVNEDMEIYWNLNSYQKNGNSIGTSRSLNFRKVCRMLELTWHLSISNYPPRVHRFDYGDQSIITLDLWLKWIHLNIFQRCTLESLIIALSLFVDNNNLWILCHLQYQSRGKMSVKDASCCFLPNENVYVFFWFKLRYKLRCLSRVIFLPVKINDNS